MTRLAPFIAVARRQVAVRSRFSASFSTKAGDAGETAGIEGTKHEWGPNHQRPDATRNYHGRSCKRCGLFKVYGKQYGSNKYPGYNPYVIDEFPTCESYEKYLESQRGPQIP